MNSSACWRRMAVSVLASVLLPACLLAAGMGTAFTYQGRLSSSGAAANGNFDFRFELCDAPTGVAMWGMVATNAIPVTNGYFAVTLDFGPNRFSGDKRYLAISVQPSGGGGFSALTPRQELTPAPYALVAASVGDNGIGTMQIADGSIMNADLGNGAVDSAKIYDGGVAGADLADGAVASNKLADGAVTGDKLAMFAVTTMKIADGAVTGGAIAQNTIGAINLAHGAVTGAKMAQDGATAGQVWKWNGSGWAPSNDLSGVLWAGYRENGTFAPGPRATGADAIAMGRQTLAAAAGSVVGGGSTNQIQPGATNAVIAGGYRNDIGAGAIYATVGGGYDNNVGIDALGAVIVGGLLNSIGTNTWAGVIAGGKANGIAVGSRYAAVLGGEENEITGDADNAVIAGGGYNRLGAGSVSAAILGGDHSHIGTNAPCSAVLGGRENAVGDNAAYALAAGRRAKANHAGAFVWADGQDADFSSGADNQFLIRAAGGMGIGTATPSGRLQVAGDEVRIGDAGTVNTATGDGDLYVERNLEVDGTATIANLATLSVSGAAALSGNLSADNGTLYVAAADDRVGIGTTMPESILHVVGDEVRIGNGGVIAYATGDGDLYVEDALEVDGSANLATLSVGGAASVGGSLTVAGHVTADDGTLRVDATFHRVGIGTNLPAAVLHVVGDEVRIGSGGSAGYATGDGDLYVKDTLEVDGTICVDAGTLFVNAVTDRVGIGTEEPSNTLHVLGDARIDSNVGIGTAPSAYHRLSVRNYLSGPSGATVALTNQSSSGIALLASVGSDATVVRLEQSGSGDFLHCYNMQNSPTNLIRLKANGTVQCKTLTITGGSDLAEPFATSMGGSPEPGMVVAIDPDNPGALRLADSAYDRCVAGIVSGAGGVNPGVLMRQDATVADGECPVALSGRAYCRVDTVYGAIRPGDLLTTSDTPGHARKVSDLERARGAILGKAMTGLAEGRGLVLVLVSLQ